MLETARAAVPRHLHGEPSGKLWTEYYTLLGDRMRTTYIESLAGWCRDHGVQLTGHLNYEKLYKSVRCNGNILKALSCFGIPGFDEANSDIALNAREMDFRRAFPLTRILPARSFSWMACRLAAVPGRRTNGKSLEPCVQGSTRLQSGFPRPSCRCSAMCRSWMKISRTSAGSGSSRVSTATRPSRESSD